MELSQSQVDGFVEQGFVHVRGAFPRGVADECRGILWRMMGLDPHDRSTWTKPVVRIEACGAQVFTTAANTPLLHRAQDQLVGPGRWVPRMGMGSFPIRFPHPDDPGDAGWHVDASYLPDGATSPWLNLRSRGRALLMLFLFSDVGEADAPTRIKVGSHLDVPPLLAEAGDAGMEFFDFCKRLDALGKLDSPARPVAHAMGEAGDVFLCHPFLVHAGQKHRGTEPRFIGQPPLYATGLLNLDGPDEASTPVELAVRRALRAAGPG